MVTTQASEEKEQCPAHPTNEETTSSARKCGTPGCDLADGHLELCTTQQVTGRRQRGPSVSVLQTGQAKEAETGTERTPALPANHKAKMLTAAEARAQAMSEGLARRPRTRQVTSA